MKPFTEMFTAREDCQRVLTEILRQGPEIAGTTLVAHVDRATLTVLSVCGLPTPDPVLDASSVFEDKPIRRLSAVLRDVALDAVPPRTFGDGGWSAITGELITVVCREGAAEVTPVEVQYWWGWRYSNHLTAAFHGDVYVVTPQGWASLLWEWSGDFPALSASPAGMDAAPGVQDAAPEVQDAERILAATSSALLGPHAGECLLCYVHRMMLEFGCDCRLRFATHYRDVRAPRATGLERRLGQVGGFCDCEIFLNGWGLRPDYWLPEVITEKDGIEYSDGPMWPDPLPRCLGVRAGSTRPCLLWSRYRRW